MTDAIIEELRHETSAGGLLIDALDVELIAALGRDHMPINTSRTPVEFAKGGVLTRSGSTECCNTLASWA